MIEFICNENERSTHHIDAAGVEEEGGGADQIRRV